MRAMTGRLDVLTMLIDAGWGDVPQHKIPPDVVAPAERGEMPRQCDVVVAQPRHRGHKEPERDRVAAQMRRKYGGAERRARALATWRRRKEQMA